jgi:membrane-associated phospholipid phosphatase
MWKAGRWARPVGVLFVVTTAIATLGLGMHWLVDLVAAVPFTWALWKALGTRGERKPAGPNVKAHVTW